MEPLDFAAVFDRYHGRIWAYLARMGGRECADDLAGDVFVAAYAGRSSYDPARGSVQSWLYGIASNMLRSRFRSDERAARAFRRAATERPREIAAVDDAVLLEDEVTRVLSALAALSAVDREVIVLFVWERLSYEAIASVLGVEVGTVRSRLSRARTRLRELVAANGELVTDG